jgi:hypothetical protein
MLPHSDSENSPSTRPRVRPRRRAVCYAAERNKAMNFEKTVSIGWKSKP